MANINVDITTTLLGDTDTPNSYVGEGGKFLAVKADESGTEFKSVSSDLTIDTTPITGGSTGYPLYHKSGNVVGEFTGAYFDTVNNRVGIGTTTPAGRLHVKGVGNLVTDVIAQFNSANGSNYMKMLGNGRVEIGQYNGSLKIDGQSIAGTDYVLEVNLIGGQKTYFKQNGDFSVGVNVNRISNNTIEYGSWTWARTSHICIQGVADKQFVLGQAAPIGGFAIGAEFGIRPTANNSNKYSFALYTHDLGGTIYQHRINQVGVHEMFNTTTPPTSVLADSFKHYAKDITAGNSAPHWKTENGDEVRLYKQPTPTTLADVITLLTNLGLC